MATMQNQEALNHEACYAALLARDARFDGHWFTGVTSTGVYCRPICRVRTPKQENCRFFHHAAGAEAAGFRPCLKCRPELAPRAFSVMEASRTLADAARHELDAASTSGQTPSLEKLAARLGISSRHLRRIFLERFGVAPLAYLQTQRLLRAKQLLTDTALPLHAVASQAGFGSTRAFQEAWQQQYRLSPSQLRRDDKTASAKAMAPKLWLHYRPPLALAALLAFLRARAVPGVEQVDEGQHSILRTVRHGHRVGQLRVQFESDSHRAWLALSPSLWPEAASVLQGVRRWLDLDADPLPIAERLAALSPIAGLRMPGGLDRFEIAVRAVLGQQVSVAAARTLAQRLVERFGERLPEAECLAAGEAWLFPSPQQLARAGGEAIATCGLPRKRADALAALAQHWPELLMATASGDPDAAERELVQLAGIGPWTAAYIRMRAWPWPDRFLPGDLVLKQQLALLPSPLKTEDWAPYRSYAVLQLWAKASGFSAKEL
jgi:AraC family transcriptional regulator of adaptative response / DNA-3-methyladenine glycosylase II